MSSLGRYSEALEEQYAVASNWASPRGSAVARALAVDGWTIRDLPVGISVPQALAWMTRASIPFYVSEDICSLIQSASESLPPSSLRDELVPERHGWVRFARPLPMPPMPNNHVYGADHRLAAACWSVEDRGLRLIGYVIDPTPHRFCPLAPSIFAGWMTGSSWDAPTGSDDHLATSEAHTLRRHLLTLFLFLQEQLLARRTMVAERHVRKRLARVLDSEPPPVEVISLRRQRSESPAGADGSSVEWSCRWIVRGHWRQQACGRGRSERRATWVLPHVKGPEHRPLKPPSERVFAVVR